MCPSGESTLSAETNIHTENMISELQFGNVKCSTHRNRAYKEDWFEVSQHKFSAIFKDKINALKTRAPLIWQKFVL